MKKIFLIVALILATIILKYFASNNFFLKNGCRHMLLSAYFLVHNW